MQPMHSHQLRDFGASAPDVSFSQIVPSSRSMHPVIVAGAEFWTSAVWLRFHRRRLRRGLHRRGVCARFHCRGAHGFDRWRVPHRRVRRTPTQTTVTPEAFRAGVLYPIAIDVLPLVEPLADRIREAWQKRREARARKEVDEALRLFFEAQKTKQKKEDEKR